MTSFYLNSNRTLLTDLKQNSKENFSYAQKKNNEKQTKKIFFRPSPQKNILDSEFAGEKKKKFIRTKQPAYMGALVYTNAVLSWYHLSDHYGWYIIHSISNCSLVW